MSSVPPSRPGAPNPPDRPELPDGIAPSRPPAAGGPQIQFRPPAARPLPTDDAPWPAWSAVTTFIGAFAVALACQVVLAIAFAAGGADLDDAPPALNITANVFQEIAFVGVPLLSSWLMFRRAAPRWFGVNRTPLWPAVGLTLLTMLAYYLLSAIYMNLVGVSESDQLPDSLGVEESTAAFVAVCILVTVLAPIAEEVLFRGYMFAAVRNWAGPLWSAVITGVVFGAIHAGGTKVEFLPALAIFGVLLGVLRWRSGSLLPCMVLHAINNSIAFGVGADGWGAWQVILLVLGSNAVILLVTWPFLGRRSGRPVAATS